MFFIDAGKCGGCGICADVCQNDAVSFKAKTGYGTAIIDAEKCLNCGMCADECPKEAIKNGSY